jgi:endonuclease-3
MIATRATRSRVKQLASSVTKTTSSLATSSTSLPDIEDVIVQSDSSASLTSLEAEPTLPPNKKRKTPARNPTSPKKVKKAAQTLSQPPPPNWEEVYAEIKAMRVNINAPVDTMGCEQLGRTESDPKVRLFHLG